MWKHKCLYEVECLCYFQTGRGWGRRLRGCLSPCSGHLLLSFLTHLRALPLPQYKQSAFQTCTPMKLRFTLFTTTPWAQQGSAGSCRAHPWDCWLPTFPPPFPASILGRLCSLETRWGQRHSSSLACWTLNPPRNLLPPPQSDVGGAVTVRAEPMNGV